MFQFPPGEEEEEEEEERVKREERDFSRPQHKVDHVTGDSRPPAGQL